MIQRTSPSGRTIRNSDLKSVLLSRACANSDSTRARSSSCMLSKKRSIGIVPEVGGKPNIEAVPSDARTWPSSVSNRHTPVRAANCACRSQSALARSSSTRISRAFSAPAMRRTKNSSPSQYNRIPASAVPAYTTHGASASRKPMPAATTTG